MEELDVKCKYYTPTLEEFHSGFEYEEETIIYTDKGWFTHKDLGWEKKVFDSTSYIENYYLSERVKRGVVDKYNPTIRVKYLDREDIESLGFNKINTEFPIGFENELYHINYRVINNIPNLCIYEKDTKFRLFSGNIKNINELKILLKQLGIL